MSRAVWTILGLAIFALSSPMVKAQLLSGAPQASAVIKGGGFGFSSKTVFFAANGFGHHFEVRSRSPLENRIEWHISSLSPFSQQLDIDVDAYSVFIPEHEEYRCQRDGSCGFVLEPDFYEDSIVSASIPLVLSRPLHVTVTIQAEPLEGAAYFELDYFDRTAIYSADNVLGQLSSATTLAPNLTTTEPLDVVTFTDRLWIPEGEHLLRIQLRSGFAEYGQIFDAKARLSLRFSTVPEPSALPILLSAVAGVVVWRRRGLQE